MKKITVCDGCKQPIVRKFIIVRGLPYHPKCAGRKTGKLELRRTHIG